MGILGAVVLLLAPLPSPLLFFFPLPFFFCRGGAGGSPPDFFARGQARGRRESRSNHHDRVERVGSGRSTRAVEVAGRTDPAARERVDGAEGARAGRVASCRTRCRSHGSIEVGPCSVGKQASWSGFGPWRGSGRPRGTRRADRGRPFKDRHADPAAKRSRTTAPNRPAAQVEGGRGRGVGLGARCEITPPPYPLPSNIS